MTVLPHEVPAGAMTWSATTQQTPAVQQVGSSLSVHKPTAVLHWPTLHAMPLLLQSASDWQQPGWLVPLQMPAEVQMSLNVQGFLSSQAVPGVDDQSVALLVEMQIWHALDGFGLPPPKHWLSIKHHPGSTSGLHWPSVGSHVAIWHCDGLGQATFALLQLPLPRSQLSVVQRLPSSQSRSLLQQPEILRITHLPWIVSHDGWSQLPMTGQSLSFLQQPASTLQLS